VFRLSPKKLIVKLFLFLGAFAGLARNGSLLGKTGMSLFLGLSETSSQHIVEGLSLSSGLLISLSLDGFLSALALQTLWGHQTLDLGGLEVWLLAFLGGDLTLDHVLADIVGLAQVEQLADLGGTLGSQAAGLSGVGQTGDVIITSLHNNEVEDGKISRDDAASDGLALALSSLALTVARMSLLQQQTHTLVGEHTLLHGETLLIVTTGDTEDVSLEVITQVITLNFLGHTLVVQMSEFTVVIDFDELLATRRRIRYV